MLSNSMDKQIKRIVRSWAPYDFGRREECFHELIPLNFRTQAVMLLAPKKPTTP
jgi:hypothetical protein